MPSLAFPKLDQLKRRKQAGLMAEHYKWALVPEAPGPNPANRQCR